MGTVIGRGSHARDILATLEGEWNNPPHHRYADFCERPLYIGINDPQIRAQASLDLTMRDESWVHPKAYLGIDTYYQYGTHINYGAMMTRTLLGHHCTIAPGVHMAGDITIGDRVFIGIGATIGNLVTIGDDAIIGAGSVVLKDVPAGTKVLGVWA